jgi:uncharacterized protein (TIGR02246 family)
MKALLILALLAACAGCNTTPPNTSAQHQADIDRADIKALEDAWLAAVKAKDLNAIMAVYVSDPSIIVFDTSTPFEYVGTDAYRKDWQSFLTSMSGPVDVSISNLEITTGGSVAYSNSIQHISSIAADGKMIDQTVRVTDGYKKINGHWLIAHEHVSIPIDMAPTKSDPAAK